MLALGRTDFNPSRQNQILRDLTSRMTAAMTIKEAMAGLMKNKESNVCLDRDGSYARVQVLITLHYMSVTLFLITLGAVRLIFCLQ